MRSGEASVTAQRVAAYRLTFDRLATDDGDPRADERLAQDVARGVSIDPALPMGRYLAARTAFFDRVVVDALDRGVEQVVVAGAGYDGRSLRYARPGVTWFEVDHPATQRDKRARLARLGLEAGAVRFVPADFTVDDVARAVRAAGHRGDVASLFLCEGVAVYLDPAVLASLLRSLRALAHPGTRLAISLSVGAVPDARRAAFAARVAAIGEPVRTVLTADAAAELFESTGWTAMPEASERARLAGLVVVEPLAVAT